MRLFPYQQHMIGFLLTDDRALLEAHFAAAQADAASLQGESPWLSSLRQRDAEYLRSRLRQHPLTLSVTSGAGKTTTGEAP